MKKALTLIVLTITPVLIFAQGDISVGNQTGLVKQWTSRLDPTLISVPESGGYVQVIAAAKGTPLLQPLFTTPPSGPIWPNFWGLSDFLTANPGWDLVSVYRGVTPAPPTQIRILDGIFPGGNQTINNIPAGADADYFVVGWTGNYTSFENALSAGWVGDSLLGASAIFTTATGDPTATPLGTPVSLRRSFEGMTLAGLIPEPSTTALAGLGTGALILFRRRR